MISSAPVMPIHAIPNSSFPRCATVSPFRTAVESLSATSFKTLSPTSEPYISYIDLNLLISVIKTATELELVLCSCYLLVKPFKKEVSVGKVCQSIIIRKILEFFFHVLAFGDVPANTTNSCRFAFVVFEQRTGELIWNVSPSLVKTLASTPA